jgi:hypothetical protein
MSSAPKLSYLPDFEGRTALYKRLNPGNQEIRILVVWPSEVFSSPLECTLQTRSMVGSETLYTFDALSYYWGSVNDLEYVLVHGSDHGAPMPSCEVPVTKSLTSALRELRKKATVAGEPLQMWTDALCINQRDAKERDFQVKAMWLIYQASRRVCVWLGDRSRSTAAENGLVSLFAFSEYFKQHAFEGNELLDEAARSMLDAPSGATNLLTSVGALMDLPYWRRGWTIQEACATRPIFFHFGGQSCKLLGWNLFYFTLDKINSFADGRNWNTHIQPSTDTRTVPTSRDITQAATSLFTSDGFESQASGAPIPFRAGQQDVAYYRSTRLRLCSPRVPHNVRRAKNRLWRYCRRRLL